MDKVVDKIVVREKNTSGIEIQLMADASAIPLTGVNHVRWYMVDNLGKVYRYNSSIDTSSLVIIDAANGKVMLYPPDETIFQYTRSPYKIHIIVYEDATKHYSVPEDGYLMVEVTKEY